MESEIKRNGLSHLYLLWYGWSGGWLIWIRMSEINGIGDMDGKRKIEMGGEGHQQGGRYG